VDDVPGHLIPFEDRPRRSGIISKQFMSESGPKPLVTVVLVCHNDGRWLPRCLESLRSQTIFERMELIIADNASQDGTDELARNLIANWPNAQLMPTGGDNGFDVACNRGAAAASGQYLYFPNPDTWLEPDCLEHLFETAEWESAGCAGGLILEYEDDRVQARGCVGFDFCGNGIEPRKTQTPEQLLYVHGFFFIRKDLYVRLGGFDEKFFMYGEEPDLSWRIWISGEKIVPALTARIHHRGSASVNPAGGNKIIENRTSTHRRFLSNRNSLLFIAKNCQHLLLLMLLPCAVLVWLEGLFVLLMTRNPAIAKCVSLDVFADCWRLRGHIFSERKRIRSFRRRGDFWMLRFFRPGFGRSYEIKAILKRGFPKFNRS
jgi:GT2 family glycosyltransferase